MELQHTSLEDLTFGAIIDAARRLRIEDPDVDAEALPLSELLRGSKRSPYRSNKVRNEPQEDPSREAYQENDGDDEYEDDGEEAHPQTAPPLPSPCLSKPLPRPPKIDFLPLHDAPYEADNEVPVLLRKGSDGIRNAYKPPNENYNSIFGGVPLTDVHTQIKEAIPSHTLAQVRFIRQRKLDRAASKRQAKRNRSAAKRKASQSTPSSKGSPRPWPLTPRPPNGERKLSLPHLPSVPFSPLRLKVIRAHSESPQRSRTRLCKQKARMSAPTRTVFPLSPPPVPPDGGNESGLERGRTRLRKDKPITSNGDDDLIKGKDGLKISNPTLQHPIMIPTVSLELASELMSPGWKNKKLRVPSPLIKEHNASSTEIYEAGGEDGGDEDSHSGWLAHRDACDRERRYARLLEVVPDMGTGSLLDDETLLRLGQRNNSV